MFSCGVVFRAQPVKSMVVSNKRKNLFFIKIKGAPLIIKVKYTIIKSTKHCKMKGMRR